MLVARPPSLYTVQHSASINDMLDVEEEEEPIDMVRNPLLRRCHKIHYARVFGIFIVQRLRLPVAILPG